MCRLRMLRILIILFIFLTYDIAYLSITNAKEDITVTIRPLYSLVKSVAKDVHNVNLLVDEKQSPHDFNLKPTDLKLLLKSKLIFYIDNNFEIFLTKIRKSLPTDIKLISILDKGNLKLIPQRKDADWIQHLHNENLTINYNHSKHNLDMHIWLSPTNAIKIINIIEQELGRIYPQNQFLYRKNAEEFINKIIKLNNYIKTELQPVKNTSFIVFHDAYQYFEEEYNLHSKAAITLKNHYAHSAKRIAQIRKKIQKFNVSCIFLEPQINSRLTSVIIGNNNNIKTAMLDPLGTNLSLTDDLYLDLMKQLAINIKKCLFKP